MIINEEDVKISVSDEINNKISKKLDVFYNPLMKFNRDITLLFLEYFLSKDSEISCLLPLAGTGVRGIRILKNFKNSQVCFNDISNNAIQRIKENIILNELELNDKITILNKDANEILRDSHRFNYVDIDPFGSPIPFLDSVFKSMKNGYIAITATDTAPLCGTYKNACIRKYSSIPLRNENMHEIGLRILIRKAQIIASQYSKALTPLLSYSKEHYFRVFFKIIESKKETDISLTNHKFFLYCNKCFSHKISEYNLDYCCNEKMQYSGPIYAEKLNNEEFLDYILNKTNNNKQILKFINLLKNDNYSIGLYDIHKISKFLKIKEIPKIEKVLILLNAKRTSFCDTGFKVNQDLKVLDIIKTHF